MPPFPRILLAALLAASPLACATGVASPLARDAETPAPLPEIRSAAPNPGMVWVPGAWQQDSVAQTWIPGHWMAPPPVP